MARYTHAALKRERETQKLPPDSSPRAPSPETAMHVEETVVRETHKASGHGRYEHGELWAGKFAKFAGADSNRGVTTRRGAGDRRPIRG